MAVDNQTKCKKDIFQESFKNDTRFFTNKESKHKTPESNTSPALVVTNY